MSERDRRKEDEEAPGGFLRRWSKRKAEARRAEPAADTEAAKEGASGPGEEDAPAGGAGPVAAAGDPGAAEPIDPRDLPDIESLQCGSDFKVFMRPGVPPELRTQALRRLWRLDPKFSRLDGLVEYGEDYTIKKHPPGAIKTAYQVGRGFANRIEEARAAPSDPAPKAGAPAPAPPADQPPAADADQSKVAAGETAAAEPRPISPAGEQAAAASHEARGDETLSDEPAADAGSTRRRPLPRRG